MANVQIKSEKVTASGGIFHVMDVFERLGLGKLVDSSLGDRDASRNAFRYGEVFETLFCSYLCGGCLEDINLLASQLSLRPGTRIPSADTDGRVLKFLHQGRQLLFEVRGFRGARRLGRRGDRLSGMRACLLRLRDGRLRIPPRRAALFPYLTQSPSKSIKAIGETSRLKKMSLHFVCVPAKWVKSRRRNILKLYTERQYYKEIFSS